jgi:hypothetical protein
MVGLSNAKSSIRWRGKATDQSLDMIAHGVCNQAIDHFLRIAGETKQDCRIATQYENAGRNFLSFVVAASIMSMRE